MVRMVREKEAWVVDEITLTPGTGPAVQLRKSLRDELAARFLSKPSGSVQTAGFTAEPADVVDDSLRQAVGRRAEETGDSGGVVHAVGHSTAQPRRGNLTLSNRPATIPKGSAAREGLDLTPPEPLMPTKRETVSESGDLQFGPSNAAPSWRQPQNNDKTAAPALSAPKPVRRGGVNGASTRSLNERPVEIPLE